MKKILFFTTGLFAVAVYSNAQNVGIGTNTPTYKLHVVGDDNGIFGSGSSYGVRGSSDIFGVYGISTGTSGYGVVGSSGYIGTYGSGSSYGLYGIGGTYGAYGSGNSYGVYGYTSSGYGVAGVSFNSYGLYGSSSSSWGSVAYGVYGAYGSGTTGYGVQGVSSSNYGVYGYSGSNWAIYGNGYVGTYGDGVYAGAWGNGGSYGLVGYGGPYGVYGQGTSYAGYFNGNVIASTYTTFSDKNLKQNIKEFSSAMDIINKLKPRQYEYRHDGNYDQMNLPVGNHYGLIAQDIELVLPNLVKDSEFETNMKRPVAAKPDANSIPSPADTSSSLASPGSAKSETINFKSVNYIELIPVMIKGMQEQDAKITELQTQNENLQNQINELKSLIQELSKKVHIATGSTTAFEKQYAPSPSNNNTVISYYIPDNVSNTEIKKTDIKGSVNRNF